MSGYFFETETPTRVFAEFLRTFFYWTIAVAVSCESEFAKTVIQMNFWLSHDLVYLNILSSSWHFCVYFWRAQAFRCILTASLTFDTYFSFFFWQRRIEVSWANLYRNKNRKTSILLNLVNIDPVVRKYDVFELSCDYRIKVSRDILGGAPSSRVSALSSFGGHRACESGDKTFLIATWPRDWWPRSPHPKSPPC